MSWLVICYLNILPFFLTGRSVNAIEGGSFVDKLFKKKKKKLFVCCELTHDNVSSYF